MPAQVSKRGAGVSACDPPPTVHTHLSAVPPERLSGRAGAPGFPSEPAAGGHRGAVPTDPRRLLLIFQRGEVPAVRPQPSGRGGDVRAVRRLLLQRLPAAMPPVPRSPRQAPTGAAAKQGGRSGG